MAAGGPSDRGPVGVTDEDDTVMSDANRTDLGDFDAPTRVARAETDVDAKDDPAPAPPRAYVPQRLGPSDIVPEFRRELRLTRFDNGGVRVFDSATGQTCMLNEFEVSLARMLDGKRRVVEILASSGRLGIPVNLESFQKFVERLEEHGLLGQAQSGAPREVATWASRGQWESSVRTLFQSGIRFLRMGKHAEAVGYFEALLEEDPQNVEALELLAMAKQAMDASAVPEPIASPMDVVDEEPEAPTVPPPTRASAPAIRPSAPAMRPPAPPMRPPAPAMRPSEPAMRPSAPAMRPSEPAMRPSASVAPAWEPPPMQPVTRPTPPPQQVPQMWQASPQVATPRATPPDAVVLPKAPPNKKARVIWLGVATLAVAAGSAVGVRFWLGQADSHDEATPSAPAGAPREATVRTKLDGSAAKPDDPKLAATDPTKPAPTATPDPAKPDTGSDTTKPDTTKPDTTKPDTTAKPDTTKPDTTKPDTTAKPDTTKPDTTKPDTTKPDTKAAEPNVLSIAAPSAGQVTAMLVTPRKVKKGEPLFQIVRVVGDPAKAKELAAKVTELEGLAKDDAMYEPFLAKARSELAGARKVYTTVVKAPRAGKAAPRVKQGTTVKAGETLADIE